MNLFVSVTTVLLPLVYLVVWVLYVWIFSPDNPLPRRMASRFTAAVVLLHVGTLLVKAPLYGRLPLGSGLEFASGLAVALLATYLYIERRRRVKQTGLPGHGPGLPAGVHRQRLQHLGARGQPAAAGSGLRRPRGAGAAGLHRADA